MRLVSVQLSGFRGFAAEVKIDLDADAIVVSGSNGNGKTSIFDAILWCLSGRVPRLGSENAALVSLYSETGRADVEVTLRGIDGVLSVVKRSCDGVNMRLQIRGDGVDLQGQPAEVELARKLWPAALNAADLHSAISAVFTRGIYLQQDLVTHFVEAATDDARFLAVSDIVGAARVAELQTALEAEKKAWTTATNQRREDLKRKQADLFRAEARATQARSSVAQGTVEELETAWAEWLRGWASTDVAQPPLDRSAATLDVALKRLAAERQRLERVRSDLQAVLSDIGSRLSTPPVASAELIAAVESARLEVEKARSEQLYEERRVEGLQTAQGDLRDSAAQLKTLAQLALQHLGPTCPVCSQSYNEDQTRKRLSAIAASEVNVPELDLAPLASVRARVLDREREFAELNAELQKNIREIGQQASFEQSVRQHLATLGVEVVDDNLLATVESAVRAADAAVADVSSRLNAGEYVALLLAKAGAVAVAEESEGEARQLRAEIASEESELARRVATGERAQRVIEAVRDGSSEIVAARLKSVRPLLQAMYSRIDPHPAFEGVDLLSRMDRGKGRLSVIVRDEVTNKQSSAPGAVLSSSQLNALAVCVFLALSLSVEKSPLDSVILDDPLQSLDDVNLLGLLDLLRRLKSSRQLLISTHDSRFASLLGRKLRPTRGDDRTIIVELAGWSRIGPSVLVRDVPADAALMHLVAS